MKHKFEVTLDIQDLIVLNKALEGFIDLDTDILESLPQDCKDYVEVKQTLEREQKLRIRFSKKIAKSFQPA